MSGILGVRCCSTFSADSENYGSHYVSTHIDKQLQEWQKTREKEVHLLLLGPGESGKSTILKQMKILHQCGYSEEERQQYRVIVHRNIVDCMCAIINAMQNMGLPFEDHARIADADRMTFLKPENFFQTELTPDHGKCVKRLWADRGLQRAYDMRADYQIYDCAQYFFENVDRVTTPGYMATVEDILYTRLETTKIVEAVFAHKDLKFKMFDVGGQRTERKKWIHCFDNVTAIIFVIALSEYNLKLAEDGRTNRMSESLTLFGSICNMRYFTDTPFILFLNKTDIFKIKIAQVPITVAFPEYAGPNDYESTSQYIQDKLVGLNRNTSKSIFSHFTNATDTHNIGFVFEAVVEIFLEHNLKQAGLV